MKQYCKENLSLADRILESYENDELVIAVIHGTQGYGKSCFAGLTVAQIYGYDFDNPGKYKENWSMVLNNNYRKSHMVFTPKQFLNLSDSKRKKGRVILWDDAGYWLNSVDRHDKLIQAVGKYLEVARTDWAGIIFTCTDLRQIFSKVRNMPTALTIKITKSGKGKESWRRHKRLATTYRAWSTEDLKRYGRKIIHYDIFNARMPDDFYNKYKPFRDTFCKQGKEDWRKILKDSN